MCNCIHIHVCIWTTKSSLYCLHAHEYKANHLGMGNLSRSSLLNKVSPSAAGKCLQLLNWMCSLDAEMLTGYCCAGLVQARIHGFNIFSIDFSCLFGILHASYIWMNNSSPTFDIYFTIFIDDLFMPLACTSPSIPMIDTFDLLIILILVTFLSYCCDKIFSEVIQGKLLFHLEILSLINERI